MVVVGVFMAAAFSLIGRNFKQGLSHPAFSLAPSSASSVHSIIISTSIADWTPSIAHLGACLRSIEECEALKGASILVVADCIPSAAEVAALPEVDAAKWAPLWHSKRASYDEYLSLVEAQIEALGRVRLVRLEQFGHLVGTVRRGIDESGASSDDVVLIMQHDLALASPSRLSQQVKAVTATLRDPQSPVQYVLLNRDCNDAPRSVSWLRPEPVVADETAAAASVEAIEAARPEMRYKNVGMETDKGVLKLCSTGGRFSDQAHFANVGWYRKAVLHACGNRRTCMEHALHAGHQCAPHGHDLGSGQSEENKKGSSMLAGATFLLGGPYSPPAVHDLVHGSMVPTARLSEPKFLACSPHFELLKAHGEGARGGQEIDLNSWQPNPWSVVMWDPENGKARGALNYKNGDASHPADAIALCVPEKKQRTWDLKKPAFKTNELSCAGTS